MQIVMELQRKNITPKVETQLVPTILEKKRNFTEYTVPPSPETEKEKAMRLAQELIKRILASSLKAVG
jgi:hypothetical protein